MATPIRKAIAVSILVGIVFAALVWRIASIHGPLTSLYGQVYYFQSAAQLWAGNGYMSCSGAPVSWIPPGYTALLLAVKWLGLPLIDAGQVISVLLAGLFAGVSTLILMMLIKSSELVGIGILLTNLNPVVIKWHLEFTSDSLHATAVLGCLAGLIAYAATRHRGWLLMAALAVAMAAVTRFVGVAGIALGAFYLLFLIDAQNLKRRIVDTCVFSTVASLPLAVFTLYNLSVSKTAGGSRAVVTSPVGEQFFEFFEEVSRWVVNLAGAGARTAISEELRIGVVAAAMLAGIGFAVYVTWRTCNGREAKLIWMPFAYAAMYFAMMVVLSSLLPLDNFSGRYILPLLAPGILWILAVLDRTFLMAARRRVLLRLGVAALLALVLIVPLRVGFALAGGTGSFANHQAAAPAIRNSALMHAIRLADAEGELAAADNAAAQFLLIHLDKCFPIADKRATTRAVLSIDHEGIETGKRRLGAPRISFSGRSTFATDSAPRPGPFGTLSIGGH